MKEKSFAKFCALAIVAGLIIICSAPASSAGGSGQEFGKVKTPMIPGVQWLYGKVVQAMVAPSMADAGGDPLLAADMGSEALMGASNYATALSNGRLFVEVSPWGELTVLRWPNATFSDQLRYFTLANGFVSLKAKAVRQGRDAPSPDWARYGRPIEPCPGLGSSGGVVAGDGRMLWSHDPVWTSSRGFDASGGVLSTELTRGDISMSVEDFIHPELDVMERSFTILGPATKFAYHATFAPFMAKPGEYTEYDPENAGFAAAYLEDDDVIVHFKPAAGTERNNKGGQPELTVAGLDRAYPEGGVFIAWGLDRGSDGHQVGADECGRVKKGDPQSGRTDARDGALSMNDYYEGKVDTALFANLASGQERVRVYIALADSATEAVGLVKRAREAGDNLKKDTQSYWSGVSNKAHLPSGAGESNLRVAKRSVLNLVVGQDRESGLIVASVSRQPAYNFDWPRDGAFFDLTLDMAGLTERVDRHHDFYASTQLHEKRGMSYARLFNFQSPVYSPAGNWPSNMAADGTVGSIPSIIPFEIDETSLLTWDLWRHAKALPEGRAAGYMARMKPTLEASADALLEYVDLKQGWTKPAFEDDSFPPNATLHGVAAVLTGLAAACDAAPKWGIAKDKQDRWCEAASVLREGARARIVRPDILEKSGWRGQAWSLWPAPMFDNFDEPGARKIKQELARKIEEKMNMSTPGFAYLGEEIFTLALADREKGEYRELLKKALDFLTEDVPFPGTDCYGEVTLYVEVGGEKVSQQRTSIPHIWNGVTVYLAAMAIYEPEAFDGMAPPPPGR